MTSSIEITLASDIPSVSYENVEDDSASDKHLVTPSDIIAVDTAYMRGHGTYVEDSRLHASVAGRIERVNKLISVIPLKTRYNGEIGDVVVGRITEVGTKRWKVETNARLDSILMLSSVNLPGGELRRKSIEDELMMREYLSEGDIISAEVQSVFSDGILSLHTRSLKYGKLSQGTLIKVSPSLVKRRKSHFHNLPCGASLIIGKNGLVWISPFPHSTDSESDCGGFVANLSEVPKMDRQVVARLRNVISLLASHSCMLDDTSITAAYDVSTTFGVAELMSPAVGSEVAQATRAKLTMEYGR